MEKIKQTIRSFLDLYNILTLLGLLVLIVYFGQVDLSFFSSFICSLFLAFSIYTAVHDAEMVAKRIGPSLGTLILALAVTVIEVGLIVNIMANNTPESVHVARDTVFAALMIVTNGIIGICMLVGGIRHKELGFQPQGTSSLMAVLGVLAALTLVLPNYTVSSEGPTYSNSQLIFASIASIVLYGALVWAQTVSHKNFFAPITAAEFRKLESQDYVPSKRKTLVSFIGLLVNLTVVIGLAKTLSPLIKDSLFRLGAPSETVGIIIALLVLAPEMFAALNAAKTNQLQTSLNLALGSGAASIALTIPVVSVYTILVSQPLVLGLDSKSTAFLFLTFVCAGFTFSTDKATTLKGIVHLVILISYIALAFMP